MNMLTSNDAAFNEDVKGYVRYAIEELVELHGKLDSGLMKVTNESLKEDVLKRIYDVGYNTFLVKLSFSSALGNNSLKAKTMEEVA